MRAFQLLLEIRSARSVFIGERFCMPDPFGHAPEVCTRADDSLHPTEVASNGCVGLQTYTAV